MFNLSEIGHHRPAIVRAELSGSETARAEGVTAQGPAPALKLCRLLIAADFDPDRPLHAFRGEMLCLVVRTIGEGSRLTVDESRTAFAPWKAFCRVAVSPSIAPFEPAASRTPAGGAP